jgi:SAM-dependent methyltransferase
VEEKRVTDRQVQLAYSEIEGRMLDERKRRQKAAKILAVLRHFLGRADLSGLRVLDLGTSAGFIASELSRAGGQVLGLDIDAPGLARAKVDFGDEATFVSGSGDRLPLPDQSIDVIVFNHIYEHVVDPDAVMTEIRRVLRPHGVVFLGLGNRLGIMEPHYGLPFLSYLPPRMADKYMQVTGKGSVYHERFRTRWGLRRLVAGLHAWDYSAAILADPDGFAARDMLPGRVRRVPPGVVRLGMALLPTYIWVASPSADGPAGPELATGPQPVPAAGSATTSV